MLPYTRKYFEELLQTGMIREIHPSDVWYQSRSDFSPEAVGTGMKIRCSGWCTDRKANG
jgi:hypothetical protein